MNILGIIPVRGGSKGIPRKNIRPLAGKPLVAYTIEAALNSKLINKVVVSTEDSEIADVSKNFGAEVIKRPENLAQDETKTAPVLLQVINELKANDYVPDIVVLLQATCPMRDEIVIDGALKELICSENDSIFTAFWATKAMPLWRKNHDGSMSALYDYHLRPRRQEKHLIEDVYCEDGALYAIKYNAFENIHDFIGNNPKIYPVERHIDIDELEDFQKVEQALLEKK